MTSTTATARAAASFVAHLRTLASDLAHVRPVAAHRFTALASGLASLTRVELVRVPALVRGTPTFARDLALLTRIHGGKAALVPAPPAAG